MILINSSTLKISAFLYNNNFTDNQLLFIAQEGNLLFCILGSILCSGLTEVMEITPKSDKLEMSHTLGILTT